MCTSIVSNRAKTIVGWDRYQEALPRLEGASADFSVEDCFALLKATSQEVCPTVVSMVYDVAERTVYWCENRDWQHRKQVSF